MNKRLFISFSLLFLILDISAYSGQKRIPSEKINNNYSYYDKGNLRSKITYKSNMKKKIIQYYYNNGKLREEGRYLNNLKDGTWKYYTIDGKLRSMINYRKNKPIEMWQYYSNINNQNLINNDTYYYQRGEKKSFTYISITRKPTTKYLKFIDLISPLNNTIITNNSIDFKWTSVSNAYKYELTIVIPNKNKNTEKTVRNLEKYLNIKTEKESSISSIAYNSYIYSNTNLKLKKTIIRTNFNDSEIFRWKINSYDKDNNIIGRSLNYNRFKIK